MKSKLEQTLEILLKEEFPTFKVKSQVLLKYGTLRLYVDYTIDELGLAFELDGIQHFKFTPHFHKSKSKYVNSKINDGYKTEILESMGYKLIRFAYNEAINRDTLREKIKTLG